MAENSRDIISNSKRSQDGRYSQRVGVLEFTYNLECMVDSSRDIINQLKRSQDGRYSQSVMSLAITVIY